MITFFILFITGACVVFYFVFKAGSIAAKYDVSHLSWKEIKKTNNPEMLREFKQNKRRANFFCSLFMVLITIAVLLGLP